jgi:hypothetical protein
VSWRNKQMGAWTVGPRAFNKSKVVCGGMGGGVGYYVVYEWSYVVCEWWSWVLCGVMSSGVGCDGWP